jgi:hypothetical protein
MATGRKLDGNPIERGALGTGMMSGLADLNEAPSAAEQGSVVGSDLQTELQKIDRTALARSRADQRLDRSGTRNSATYNARHPELPHAGAVLTVGVAAVVVAAVYKAVRGRTRGRRTVARL